MPFVERRCGGRLFKVGTNRTQRVFKATPWHDGAAFDLIRVEEHGTDREPLRRAHRLRAAAIGSCTLLFS